MKRFMLALLALPLLAQPTGYTPFGITAGTTRIIAAVSTSSVVSIYHMSWSTPSPGSGVTFSYVAGTGTNCATNQTQLYPVSGTSGYAQTDAEDWQGALKAPMGQDFCITTSGAINGAVSYQQ